jgi:hypothetical protein
MGAHIWMYQWLQHYDTLINNSIVPMEYNLLLLLLHYCLLRQLIVQSRQQASTQASTHVARVQKYTTVHQNVIKKM